MSNCCRCNSDRDYVSIKKFDATDGEFQWEILNLENYEELFDPVFDDHRYAYLDYTSVGNLEDYESEFGPLTYPTVQAGDSTALVDPRYYRYNTLNNGSNQIIDFLPGEVGVLEYGVTKISLELGIVEYQTPLGFITSHTADQTLFNSTTNINSSRVDYSLIPNGDMAGDYALSQLVDSGLFALNAGDPTQVTKSFLFKVAASARSFADASSRPFVGSVYRLTLPEIDGNPSVQVNIDTTFTDSQIINTLISVPQIDAVEVIRSGFAGFLVKITWNNVDMINFQSIEVLQTFEKPGYPDIADSVTPEFQVMNIITKEVVGNYYLQDYPDSSPARTNGRIYRHSSFSLPDYDIRMQTCVDGVKIFAFSNYQSYLYKGIDRFDISDDGIVLDWGRNIDLTNYYSPHPPYEDSRFNRLMNSQFFINDNYIGFTIETLEVVGGPLATNYHGEVIDITDGSRSYLIFENELFLSKPSSSRFIGSSSDIFLSERLDLIDNYGSGDENGKGAIDNTLSHYRICSNGIQTYATNTNFTGSLLSDGVTLIGGTSNITRLPDTQILFGGILPGYAVDRTPEYLENLVLTSGYTLRQKSFGYIIPTLGRVNPYFLYSFDFITTNNSIVHDNKWRFVIDYAISGLTYSSTSNWFDLTTTIAELQGYFDSVFGVGTDGFSSMEVFESTNLIADNGYITGPEINSGGTGLDYGNDITTFYSAGGGISVLFYENRSAGMLPEGFSDAIHTANSGNSILDNPIMRVEYYLDVRETAYKVSSNITNKAINWSRNIGLVTGDLNPNTVSSSIVTIGDRFTTIDNTGFNTRGTIGMTETLDYTDNFYAVFKAPITDDHTICMPDTLNSTLSIYT